MTYLGTSLVGVVVMWIVLWVLASLVTPTVRVSQVILVVGVSRGGLLVLGAARAWVVGGSGCGVLPLPSGGRVCAGGRLVVGWLAVLVVPVVSGVRVVPSGVFWSVVVGVAPFVVEGVDAVGRWWCCCDAAVGGAGDVVGEGAAGGAPGVGAAGDADGEGVVGDAPVDGGVLTVPWGWDLATPGGGSRGRCWPVCWPWQCWPCLVWRPCLVSLMPMELTALYWVVPGARAPLVVSPRALLLMLWVAVAEVALLVVLLLMPVARPLRALLRFTVSLMLLMLRALLVVDVGLCVGGQWLVFRVGLPLLPGGRWLVPLALTGRVCSRWCGPLVMPLVRVLQVMPRVMSSVRPVSVAPVVWVPLVMVWWMASCAMFWWRGRCC